VFGGGETVANQSQRAALKIQHPDDSWPQAVTQSNYWCAWALEELSDHKSDVNLLDPVVAQWPPPTNTEINPGLVHYRPIDIRTATYRPILAHKVVSAKIDSVRRSSVPDLVLRTCYCTC